MANRQKREVGSKNQTYVSRH